ncbi:protein NRT1/ PTR FAMILY 5.2-like isoform X2 [Telopea speciosissima]|uniref:protein NRT1/ PTR FAMILY 5.2-like isoform X2 n=1 Tax=Telopea speciosissima TaxID=54955 RepID=UPI001CC82C4F|nr:protein NRT1/ PTR FAMILY 5.2-like isoform X2 [Telopea speciosissima]
MGSHDLQPNTNSFLSITNMSTRVAGDGLGDGREDYTQDGTVDLKGHPILRSKGGKWKACSFIVGYEVFERMAYYGIASNLVLYLTKKLHEGTVSSSNNVTNWVGTVWMTPIIGAYIADAHLGRYWTFVISSGIYLVGMCLLTLAVSLPALRQVGIFYCALYLIAVGAGGTKPNISTMGADQFDYFEPKEKVQKLSFFNWWMFSIFFGTLLANTFLVYLQDNVGWSIGYAIPTVGLAISVLVFLVGTPFYRHKVISGSPFTRMARVLVAAMKKRKLPVPYDPKELHELSLDEYATIAKVRIDHTPSMRNLDKAAVRSSSSNPWMLCTVTQVEETKQMIRMIPILVATFIPSTMLAQVQTLFIKQGTTLDRSMGPHFDIPPACLTAFVTLSMLMSLIIYDQYFVPLARRYTGNPRGITLLQRMGIGLVMHVIIMATASLTERKRLDVARDNSISASRGETIPLSIFILLPQFALMGVADTFVEVAKIEFFYDQAPEGMKSLGTSYYTSSMGIGNFLNSFLLQSVCDITKKNGKKGWISDNLNESHLDYFYGLYAALSLLNFLFFLIVTKFYVYNTDFGESEVCPDMARAQDEEGLKGCD